MMAGEDIRRTYSPVGLRLIDDLTGEAPLGVVRCTLLVLDAPQQWRVVDVPRALTPTGVLVFPDLGRSTSVTGAAPRHYSAVLHADFYILFFFTRSDGFEFDAFPFDDTTPPAQLRKAPDTIALVPRASYPFAPYQRVLRGRVVDANGPLVNVEVSHGNVERTVSDTQGVFALPLRLTPNNTPVTIDAIDHRNNRHAEITVTLPADLGKNQTITIS